MRAVELTGFEGFRSLRTVEVDTPKPRTNEVLIAVEAAGINFAEIVLTKGKYPSSKPLVLRKKIQSVPEGISDSLSALSLRIFSYGSS